ncbi:MAG: mandelate racemase/muconate lactonizing enzyme family protein [Deltaproteobacteria bacterium]|nr:mandelate racemase/muconate lactonizing enzyme family protein [Deltaproteobacteria bacterium]MBW2122024.1 mandelate racemase/muconate lactonizing enzyme family protein [Deltaproteobacteria bacterium]
MKIRDLRSTILSVPFAKPTFWPYGRWDGITVAVVEIETDTGIVGIGESVCLQSPAESVKGYLDGAKPLLVGEDPFDTERIGRKLEGLGGWAFARHFAGYFLGGIDMALWDIIGKACGQPLYKLLGGKVRDRAACFKFIHHDEPRVMAADAEEAVAQGYGTIYCKYTTVDHLKEAIAAMREAIGDEPRLWVDFNGTLSPGFAVRFLREMERYRIDIAEQPVLPSNLDGMAYVRNSVSSQILAHESSWTLGEAMNVVKRGAADIISVEPRMTWGILATKKAAAIAEAAGMAVIMHSAAELGVATAAFLHVIASTPNFILANQCMYDWFDDDYIKGGKLRFEKGCLPVPHGPGLGVELDRDKMAQYNEKYKEVGSFPIFGARPEELPTAPTPLWPAY